MLIDTPEILPLPPSLWFVVEPGEPWGVPGEPRGTEQGSRGLELEAPSLAPPPSPPPPPSTRSSGAGAVLGWAAIESSSSAGLEQGETWLMECKKSRLARCNRRSVPLPLANLPAASASLSADTDDTPPRRVTPPTKDTGLQHASPHALAPSPAIAATAPSASRPKTGSREEDGDDHVTTDGKRDHARAWHRFSQVSVLGTHS